MAVSSKRFVRARISLCTRPDGHSDHRFNQAEPQHGQPLFALDSTGRRRQLRARVAFRRRGRARRVLLRRAKGARQARPRSPWQTIVFGIYKRDGRVYTEVVPNCKKDSLQAIIRGKVELAATIHTDGFRSYDGIVHMGYQKHYRVRHDRDEFVRGSAHINGIEGFWGMAKTRLVKFRGMSRSTFYLHLKECEFRFNHRDEDLYQLLLKITRSAIAI